MLIQVLTDGPSLVYPTDPYLTDYSRPSPVVEAAMRDNNLSLTAASTNLCRTERDLQAAENSHLNFVYRFLDEKFQNYLFFYRPVVPSPAFVPDDLTFKMRPDTAHVVGRDYARYNFVTYLILFHCQTQGMSQAGLGRTFNDPVLPRNWSTGPHTPVPFPCHPSWPRQDLTSQGFTGSYSVSEFPVQVCIVDS